MVLALLRGLLTQQVMQAVSQDAFSANSPALGAAREAAASGGALDDAARGELQQLFDSIERVQARQAEASAATSGAASGAACGRPARRPQHALHAARRGGRASGA
jgi:hypothetical protein